MKTYLALTSLASSILIFSMAPARADDCGTVTLANGTWQSAELLANVDKRILEEGFGCSVEFVIGDTVPMITSMVEKGQPDVMPEAWVNLMPEVVQRGTAQGMLFQGANVLPDGGVQGWWMPKYLADAHPDITTIGDALKHPDLFPDLEDKTKGAVINGPAGWGGTIATAQLFNALNAGSSNFVLVDSGSAAGLDGTIAKFYERKEGFIAFYWSPTSLLGKYPMVRLDEGVEHDAAEWKRCNTVADCREPKVNAWPVDQVYTLFSKPFANRASPAVKDYLSKRAWSNETVNKVMAWMLDNQATGEEGAKHFLAENPTLWHDWVSPDVAEKVKSSL